MKTLKVDFISDTHIDFWISQSQDIKLDKLVSDYVKYILKPLDGDVLVIAGDLGHYYNQDTKVLLKLKEYYKEIILVKGNHDLYLVSSNIQQKYKYDSINRIIEMKDFCNEANIYYLDGDSIVINEFKIGGVGMWYNTPEKKDIYNWIKTMNDANLIMKGKPCKINYGYGAQEVIPTFDTQKYYLEEVEKLKSLIDLDLLVTHICPIIIPEDKMPMQYHGLESNMFYMSDNLELVKKTGTDTVIFGHTHEMYNYILDDILYICNPLGYKGEKTNRSIKQIELFKD